MKAKILYSAMLVTGCLLMTACGNDSAPAAPAAPQTAAAEVADKVEAAKAVAPIEAETAVAQAEPAAADAEKVLKQGKQAFMRCIACHTVDANGPATLGPNLHGVVGRAAATQEGFAYSAALQNSGLTWDEETLQRWISNPAKTVPGTKMVYVNTLKQDDVNALIRYLSSNGQ